MPKKPRKSEGARALLAANLHRLRVEHGYSQENLAELAGFHRTYVSQVERAVSNVSVDNVQKLAAVLKVPVAHLFTELKGG